MLMNKWLKFFLLGLLGVVVILNVYIISTSQFYIYKALYYNFADIDDYKIFPNREIAPADQPEEWKISSFYNKVSLPEETEKLLADIESIAFLVIKDDSILIEKYWQGYSDSSLSGSFSMAKSYVSALTGIALKEGYIKSLEQPVGDFIPDFNEGDKKKIKILHLLTMSSGLDWEEAYASPISITTEAYYGNDLEKVIKKLKVVKEPGVYFNYKSGDTQILGMVLEKATGIPLASYMEEKLWKKVGARNKALWSLDKDNGYEKAYCCLNSNARDFARLGKLYLQHGRWNGEEIIPKEYVNASISPNGLIVEGEPSRKADFYGYSWWIVPEVQGEKVFYARGILGQYIMVIPSKNMIIVRLGKKRLPTENFHFGDVYKILEGCFEAVTNIH